MKNISKKNFTFFVNKPFTIFEIDNFLPEEEFLKLLHSYPSESNFKTEVDNIMTFSNKSEKDKDNFNNFLENNNYWNNFFKKIKSPNFINSAYYTSVIPNFKSRGLSSFKRWTLNEKNNLFKKLFRKIDIHSRFSINKYNGFLNPHTDARSALMSMVYYISNDFEDNCGTEFWKIKKNEKKWKGLTSRISKMEFEEFKNDCEVFHKSIFKPNKLIGFFRNDISIHSVTTSSTNISAKRKALSFFIKY